MMHDGGDRTEASGVTAADGMDGQETSGRADARRNRERLLAAAAELFGAVEGEVTLSAVAARAGVGIGTLYRHFPTREALVEAVYRNEVDRLCQAAEALLRDRPPEEALVDWMDRYAAMIAAKRGMAEVLTRARETDSEGMARTKARIRQAMALLLDAAARAGAIRGDADPDDVLLAAAAGIWSIAGQPDWRQRAGRLLRLVLDGLRYRPGG
ncbi:helix-turn-helix domain-containing protein [Inquilinus sp.]|uniref:TetR/AcrR family transcriptional regulator n=1 Tax=Inquilinus sp. TaxID=1932117 RepID=UPI0031CF7B09